ncbi:acyltransferase [Epilithonimonas vandammei]|uniref:Acyltransferase n=1 Tax=Epilithonimonas vandammei TaxID=2487072 RepID=A0A3G8Y701_9FLAO|nr:acyltransferase [Epilithonimonas vandammei]AZI41128.1 acyltransferase [Epilithonimonas vandammei]
MRYLIFKIYTLKIFFNSIYSKILLKIWGVEYDIGLKILMCPILVKHKSAKIILGKNVTLNSDKKYYHLGMFSKVKLMADKKESIIKIGDNTRINGVCIHAFNIIEIGKNCLIAANTQIIDSNGHLLSFDNPSNRKNTQDNGKPIIIKDDVWIGTGCIILGDTLIEKGAVIAANSVVKGHIPANCLYGGNPAKLIKKY